MKKSYTLSAQTVAFLETMRRTRGAESLSSVLEDLLDEARRAHERASVERATADYYSSLQDSEAREQTMWGAFALDEFLNRERP